MLDVNALIPFDNANGELMRLMVVLGAFFLVFVLTEIWHHTLNPPTEWTRKFIHLTCGLIIACFHWIFVSFWPILLLSAILGSAMLLARMLYLFPSIYNVQRSTLGDIFYLVSICLLYLISYDHPLIYFISVLVLTVADSLAAIVGSTYQTKVYTVETHTKSLAGSSVFFITTFLIVFIPLWIMTDLDRLSTLLISFQVALVVTFLEAVCINGLDNVLIPFGTYFLLLKLMPQTSLILAWEITWQAILVALLYYIALQFPFLSFSGAIAGQLFLYGAFLFGGPTWLVVPLISLGTFITTLTLLIYPKQNPPTHKIYQVVAAFHILIVPATLYFAHSLNPQTSTFYVLFIGAMTAHLTIALWRILWLYSTTYRPNYKTLLTLATSCYILLIPFGLWIHTGHIPTAALTTDALLLLTSIHIFYLAFKQTNLFQQFPWEFRIQSFSVLCGTLLGDFVP